VCLIRSGAAGTWFSKETTIAKKSITTQKGKKKFARARSGWWWCKGIVELVRGVVWCTPGSGGFAFYYL
jgi:hypothetical protein